MMAITSKRFRVEGQMVYDVVMDRYLSIRSCLDPLGEFARDYTASARLQMIRDFGGAASCVDLLKRAFELGEKPYSPLHVFARLLEDVIDEELKRLFEIDFGTFADFAEKSDKLRLQWRKQILDSKREGRRLHTPEDDTLETLLAIYDDFCDSHNVDNRF